MTNRNEGYVATGLRLPEDLHKRIRQAADERGMPMQYLMTKLVEEGLDRLIPADELRLTVTE